jgi:hypothetical protein
MRRLFAAICLAALLPGTAWAQSLKIDLRAEFSKAFPSASGTDPYIIRFSPGGKVFQFELAAEAVRLGKIKSVVIDGPCISACTLFADDAEVRKHLCITDRASFGFHHGTLTLRYQRLIGYHEELVYFDLEYSPGVAAWIERTGGLPYGEPRMMNAKVAAAYWRRCPHTTAGR